MLSVSAVREWNPSALQDRAVRTEGVASQVDDVRGAMRATTADLWSSWSGIAADAAADHLDREHKHSRAIVDELHDLAAELRSAHSALTDAVHVALDKISDAERAGFAVDDTGVRPGPGFTFLAHVAADATAHWRIIQEALRVAARWTTTAHDESVGVSPKSRGNSASRGVLTR